ncbi:metallophosphoesterase family protein [Thermodesulfobacteriota bacterium]
MKIGVISDTHLKRPNRLLEKIIEEHFNDVDLVLHAGDLTSLEVLDAFKGKELITVTGNSDKLDVRKRLSEKEVFIAEDYKIGLIHGWGSPLGLEKRVASSFEGIHCIVFGHSHLPVNHQRNGILFFNPGSFSGGLFSMWKRSIGFLTIDTEIRGEIVRL